jgi:hypothetical protein
MNKHDRSNKPKPKVKLVGEDGNIYNLLAICTNALIQAGQDKEAKELKDRVVSCDSYSKAIGLMYDYVEHSSGDSDDE